LRDSRYPTDLPAENRNLLATVKRAKRLRRDMTDAERRLWARLRRDQIEDCPFRKQVPIGPYIADFACLPLKLVIEVDGSQHSERPPTPRLRRTGKASDERRTAWLEARGYRVLRFWNNEVLGEIAAVSEVIRSAVLELKS
jgi:very-short-patch-repair endonuclease